jgi:hypothetical protein
MKLNLVCLSLILIGVVGFSAHAAKPEKIMAKVRYERYTGPQPDWPRSTAPVMAAQIRRDMPIFNQLPDRPYEILGVMYDEGEMSVKHVAQAARLAGADALLVANDPAFAAAGLKANPRLLENADIPDPKGPRSVRRLDRPDLLKTADQPATIRVTQVEAILIRWKTR